MEDDGQSDTEVVRAQDEPVRPDLNPLRAAGWLFFDGDCIEIERQSEDGRTRVLAD
jgi:hypothetical protein